MVNVIQGQRATWLLDAAGHLIQERKTLARAEDNHRRAWQVTLAPITQLSVGTDLAGMPAWRGVPTGSGNLTAILTWGGGGVGFSFPFRYPVAGTSFVVSGDNVIIEVQPQDLATVFTEQNKPSIVGWVKPAVSGTSAGPLVIAAGLPNGLPGPVYPFARALLVGVDTAAATMVVAFSNSLGVVVTFQLPAGFHRIPVPAGAEFATVTPSAGIPQTMWELALT